MVFNAFWLVTNLTRSCLYLIYCPFSYIFKQLDAKIIYSGGIDLDILPQGAGKGQALAYLLSKFKAESKLPVNTLVCGDSGNDAELFSIPDVYGVMVSFILKICELLCMLVVFLVNFFFFFCLLEFQVSNAQEELLQWHAENAKNNKKIIHATQRCAAGIIEAIGHFGLGPNASPRDGLDLLSCKTDNSTPANIVVNFFIAYERWRRAEVEKSESFIQSLKDILVSASSIHQFLQFTWHRAI